MSADGATGAGEAAPGEGGIAAGFEKSEFGSVDEVRDVLGLNDLEDAPPDDRGANDAPDEIAAKRDAKGKFQKADPADKAKPDPKAAKEDDDVATIRAIEARGKARRAASRAARAASAPAAQTQPTPAAKTDPPPAARAATPVEAAVKDVLAQIAALAGNDADASAGAAGAAAPDTTERKAALDAITAKLDELKSGALKATEDGQKQIEAMQAQLKAIESDRVIRRVITKAIDPVLDELPMLSDPKALRAFNREHGTEYGDAIEMIAEAAGKYFEKFKVAPDMAALAQRIERKLSGKGPEQTDREKPTPKSKTVSRSDGSPPAARANPDERSYEEAQEDFRRRFGLD